MIRTILLSLIALTFIACEDGDNNDLPNKPTENNHYKGTMTVDQNDGTMYTQEDVEVNYELRAEGKLNFKMYDVKFAKAMPLKLDMTVEGVSYTMEDGIYTLTGNGLIPYALGGPFEKFTITQLKGTITDNAMSLIFMCGEYPVTYHGTR